MCAITEMLSNKLGGGGYSEIKSNVATQYQGKYYAVYSYFFEGVIFCFEVYTFRSSQCNST